MTWTLEGVVPSPNDQKKYRALFRSDKGTVRHSDFGAAGMEDYTTHRDLARRNRYITRHAKDLKGDPLKPGYLSMFILWNRPSFQASVKDYRKRLAAWNDTGAFPTDIPGYQ